MKKEQIIEVIEKLVEGISPVGDASVDSKIEENLKVFIEVFEDMHDTISSISYDNKDFHQASIKSSVALCDKALRGVVIDSEIYDELVEQNKERLEALENLVNQLELEYVGSRTDELAEAAKKVINNAKS